ncbi:hypothetical protein [Nocardiopsis alborubida]|uniref:MBL fold metallo-hydrolase n=1 Tax=Nocardiopsis alborubida TaxID=146802 RepID=A0A7X6RNH2_9ACTN|nr:hypothetical protein [Nocardiopsis alborubida]NKY96699.1 hypothetical protein [Nocardiopsis alborubida]
MLADATLTRTHHTHSPGAPTLSRLSPRVWTTRWTASPGASLLVDRHAKLTLVDHGLTQEAAEELLSELYTSAPGLRVARVVWLRWDHGLSERVPQRVELLYPRQMQASDAPPPAPARPQDRQCRARTHHTPLIGLPDVTLHAIAPEQGIVWDAADRILIAGDLLAPLAPELSALTPTQAAAALEWALDHQPRTVVGAHGTLIRSTDHIERALRARLSYLRVLEGVCIQARRTGAPPQIAVGQAMADGRLGAWPVAPERHLVNIHAGLAELEGRALDLREVVADVRALASARPGRTR